jgi:hypothetical protein
MVTVNQDTWQPRPGSWEEAVEPCPTLASHPRRAAQQRCERHARVRRIAAESPTPPSLPPAA